MQEHFNTVFQRLVKANFDENTLCREFWLKLKKLHANFNEKDCWNLLMDNMEWVLNTGTMTTNDLVGWFTKEELSNHDIYTEGHHKINNGFAIGIKTANIEAVGHSRVILFDNARCEAFDTTFVTGFNDSFMVLKNCVGDAFNNCRVVAKDFSKVEAWDNSKVTAESYTCVMAHDNAQVENTYHSHTVIV